MLKAMEITYRKGGEIPYERTRQTNIFISSIMTYRGKKGNLVNKVIFSQDLRESRRQFQIKH